MACGSAKPPEKLPPPEPRPKRPSIPLASLAPDTDPRRPWPLNELPSNQPHLDLAMAADLCTGGWAARHTGDLAAYGEAWCRIRANDEATGVDALGQLARSKLTRADIAKAARLDVVNLVASAMPADLAVDRLRVLGVADLDLLAATYGALGMRRDAALVVELIETEDPRPTWDQRCERALAWGTLENDRVIVTRSARNAYERCARRARVTACALEEGRDNLLAIRECFNELPESPDLERRAWLIVAVKHWDRARWLHVARDARNALPLDAAEELAVSALEAAQRDAGLGPAGRGPPVSRDALRAEARALLDHEHHHPRFDARLRALLQ